MEKIWTIRVRFRRTDVGYFEKTFAFKSLEEATKYIDEHIEWEKKCGFHVEQETQVSPNDKGTTYITLETYRNGEFFSTIWLKVTEVNFYEF